MNVDPELARSYRENAMAVALIYSCATHEPIQRSTEPARALVGQCMSPAMRKAVETEQSQSMLWAGAGAREGGAEAKEQNPAIWQLLFFLMKALR